MSIDRRDPWHPEYMPSPWGGDGGVQIEGDLDALMRFLAEGEPAEEPPDEESEGAEEEGKGKE